MSVNKIFCLFPWHCLAVSTWTGQWKEILKGQNHHFVEAPAQRPASFTPDHFPKSFSFLLSSLDNSLIIDSMPAEVRIQSWWTIFYPCKKFFIKKKREVLSLQTKYTLYTLTSTLTTAILLVLDNSIYQKLNNLIRPCF